MKKRTYRKRATTSGHWNGHTIAGATRLVRGLLRISRQETMKLQRAVRTLRAISRHT